MRKFYVRQNQPILLGRRGENLATEVLIDVRTFYRDFGDDATFTMLHQPAGAESPYAAAISVEDGILHWAVNNVDTATEGAGEAMLICYVNEQIAKSVIYKTKVEPTLGEEVEPPPAFEPFANRIAELNAKAQTAANRAVEAEIERNREPTAEERLAMVEDAFAELCEVIFNG